PELVARRVQRALDEEAAARSGATGTESVEIGRRSASGSAGSALPRRSRWPKLVLAAAALVVVGAGVGQLWEDVQGGGGAGAGATQGAPPEQFDSQAQEREDAEGPAAADAAPDSTPEDQAQAPREQRNQSLGDFFKTQGRLEPRRYRDGCVSRALEDPDWQGYSYRFVRQGRPDVVAVQPAGDLFRVSIIRCEPRPRVVTSGRLPDPA
ncbi:MAG: hypothetical protein M3P83_13540, partial [Actinomycetota bacterium]|nr:hypothetical protein [Actinomycetota bacterium]